MALKSQFDEYWTCGFLSDGFRVLAIVPRAIPRDSSLVDYQEQVWSICDLENSNTRG